MFAYSNSQGACYDGDPGRPAALTGGFYARFTDTAAIPPKR